MTRDAAPGPNQVDSDARQRLPAQPRDSLLLTVAGFDPSGGAGIAADLKSFWNHGFYGLSAITALTVQSTQGVLAVHPVPGPQIRQTLECLAADLPLAAIKVGMLATAAAVHEVAAFLKVSGVDRGRIVLDPIIRSSSGMDLLEPQAVEILRTNLLPRVGWITPNLAELAALTGQPVPDRDAVPAQARLLQAMAGAGLNVVVTGGHLDPPDDYLLTAQGKERWFPGRRVDTTSTHGTGCAFSSAFLCRLVLGDEPAQAVEAAKAWVAQALKTAVPIGKGRGPVVL